MADYLDPATYAGYKQQPTFDIDGAHVRWIDIPPGEHRRILPIIRDHAAYLMDRYDVSSEEGSDYVYLRLRFRTPATPVATLHCKAAVNTVLKATNWGGPGAIALFLTVKPLLMGLGLSG